MSAAEWARILTIMGDRWPSSATFADEHHAAQMFADLRDLPGDQVATAVEVLHRSGREWAPGAGQIRAQLVDLALDAPPWSEVRSLLARPQTVNAPQTGCESCGGSTFRLDEDRNEAVPCECRVERLNRAKEAHHPLVAAFLERTDPGDLRELHDPVRNAQARDAYREFVGRASEDSRLEGVESAGLRRLARVNGEPKQLGAALRDALPNPERTTA